MIGVSAQIHAIGKVGAHNDIVAVEVLYHAVFLQRHHPAGILMHAIIDDKDGHSAPQGRFYKYGRIQLKYHKLCEETFVPGVLVWFW